MTCPRNSQGSLLRHLSTAQSVHTLRKAGSQPVPSLRKDYQHGYESLVERGVHMCHDKSIKVKYIETINDSCTFSLYQFPRNWHPWFKWICLALRLTLETTLRIYHNAVTSWMPFRRIYPNAMCEDVGCELSEDLSQCEHILGIKKPKVLFFTFLSALLST
ncbi:protein DETOXIFICATION 27-like [Prunus yedoensis var. nudiflora]|uniref:Protein DETOXIFICATION 27-like n=1 Tax=Prunus yedoensis var. nudiflora TaxID=2094558 RepID=A0A314Y2Y3_PRUYE|nr:protein DETOXIFICATION 27-like [Prunus yedoensis var. nudiflora]